MKRLGIVADDLTGAMNTGVQFAKWGLRTLVMLDDGEMPDADAVVISTDSRQLPAPEAYCRAKEAAQRLSGRIPYKKIDSTLRGNVGAEIDGLLEGLGWGRALVAPAFPATGRTTVDGYHYVDGVPLSESAFANDSLWPAVESHLPTLLASQTRRRVGHLPLGVVEGGVGEAARFLARESAAVVVADALEQRHLHTLAMALAQVAEDWLPCGSAGLAEEWPAALGLERPANAATNWSPDSRPALVVAGSRNLTTARQLERAADAGSLHLIQLAPGSGQGDVERVTTPLSQGICVALTTTFSTYREGMDAATAEMLARATVLVLEQTPVSGMILTGGDVALAVCHALGASALRIVGEVQAGVPAGTLVGGSVAGLRAVTKAGGFGDDDAILHGIDFIQGRS